MKVLRYGHLRSAPVVVDVGVRTEWEPPTLRAALSVSTRPSGRLLDGFVPLRRRQSRAVACFLMTDRDEKDCPECRERLP